VPIDPTIPFLAFQGLAHVADQSLAREKLRAEQEDRIYRQQQQQQLIESRELELEQKRREAEGIKLLTENYKQFTANDPTTGSPKTDYDKLAGAMFTGGYPEIADRLIERGQQMRKADEDYWTSRLTHDKNLTQWKLAELSMVESPEDYAHALERMKQVPGIDVSKLPQQYDPEYVKTTTSSLQRYLERYQQALDPQGYQTKQTAEEKSRAELDEIRARTTKLTAETEALTGKKNQTPEDFYKIIDDTMAKIPGAQNYTGSVQMAKGRIGQAMKVGDVQEAKKAIEDLTHELTAVNVARQTAPIRYQYGPYGPMAAQSGVTPTGPIEQWLSSGAPPGAEIGNKASPELGGYTPNAVFQAAVALNFEGKEPGGNTRFPTIVARNNAIKNMAAAMLPPGVNMSDLRAEFKNTQGAVGKMMSLYMGTSAAAEAATHNLDYALQLSPNVSRTDSRWVNEHVQKFLGDFTKADDLTEFEVAIYTAAREYAKVTSGAAMSVSGLSDSASKEASRLLAAAQSPKAFAAAIKTMKYDMAQAVNSQRNIIASKSKPVSLYLEAWEQMRSPTGGAVGGGAAAPAATPAPSVKDLVVKNGVLTAPTAAPDTSGAVPDLSKLPSGQLAVFTSGPFKGKWKKDAQGRPVKVAEVP
jgi:hypothetical protein